MDHMIILMQMSATTKKSRVDVLSKNSFIMAKISFQANSNNTTMEVTKPI